MNEWSKPEHAERYLNRQDSFPHRKEGEAVVLEQLGACVRRFLDLGTGDGRLLALVKEHLPGASAVGLDRSEPMLNRARERFAGDSFVQIVQHDLQEHLPDLGRFDAVVSSLAIHHLEHGRKKELYREILGILEPGGVFCNFEHVSSPTRTLHERFRQALGIAQEEEDPSNRCLDVQTQLSWLREIGFRDVDCYWKWMEMALLCGYR